MGNSFHRKKYRRQETFHLQLLKNLHPINIGTQTIVAQTMQSNRYQRMSPPPVHEEPKPKTTPVVTEEEYKDYKPKDRPKHFDTLVRLKFPLGMHKTENTYQYNFWAPETFVTMKDFVEIHSIPVYELKSKTNFRKYCIEREWFNTAEKFRKIWESINTNTSRLICGVRGKFDVSINLSDCFMDTDGSTMRAYSIIGGNPVTVGRAFSFLSDTWTQQFHQGTRWHHDATFDCMKDFEEPRKPHRDACGCLMDNIKLDKEFECIGTNNLNSFPIDSVDPFNKYNFNSNANYVAISIPKNHEFDIRLIDKQNFQYEIIKDNKDHDVIVIRGETAKLNKLKHKLQAYLSGHYIFREKYLRI